MEANKKIGFKDLGWFIRIPLILWWIVGIVFTTLFIIGFLNGLLG